MTILALEFSSAQRSVAVLGGNVAAETVETGGRSTAAFGMIEKVLSDAKIHREQVEVIAVGLGPGSYTGIRSAIAIAEGWQLARPIRLIGISSVEAIASRAQREKIYGDVDIVIDAQRGEVYHARYAISATTAQETSSLRIIRPADLTAGNAATGTVVGPEATRWVPSGKILHPDAMTIARLARDRSFSEAGLEPIYLRETTFVKAPPPRHIA